MRTRHIILIRFIDLGLLLLMAFLATANLVPQIQVSLPHGVDASDAVSAYRIEFDAATALVRREPAATPLCQVNSLRSLAACLRALGRTPGPFLLAPMGSATVQHLVRVMDVCRLERLLCMIAPMP